MYNISVWPTNATVSFPEGILVDADLNSIHAFYREILLFGETDSADIRIVRHLLRPRDVFVDAGANLGYYSLVAGRCVGPSGQVYAFEPLPEVVERLEQNVARSRSANVTVVACALGDRIGNITLYSFSDDPVNAFASVVAELPDRHSVATHVVPITTLDEYLHQQEVGTRVSLVKMDVEGSELPVFKGARRLLSRPDPPVIVFEYNPVTQTRAGYQPQDILTHLAAFGYSFYRATIRRHPVLERLSRPRLIPFEPESVSENDSPNVWCLASTHRSQARIASLLMDVS